jgi:KTSC domain
MSTPHMNRYFHWCAGCWDWICDCKHCVEPLTMKRRPVKDVQIRSVGYDRRRGRLEIEFTWTDDVRQFYPVPPAVYRQLLTAKPMYLFLNRTVKSRGLRFEYVRTEAKRAIMLAGIATELLRVFDSCEAT